MTNSKPSMKCQFFLYHHSDKFSQYLDGLVWVYGISTIGWLFNVESYFYTYIKYMIYKLTL